MNFCVCEILIWRMYMMCGSRSLCGGVPLPVQLIKGAFEIVVRQLYLKSYNIKVFSKHYLL